MKEKIILGGVDMYTSTRQKVYVTAENGKLYVEGKGETLLIEAWGPDALRVRATMNGAFTGKDHALTEPHSAVAEIAVGEEKTTVRNGRIAVEVDMQGGWLAFFKDGKALLREYARSFNGVNPHAKPLFIHAREYKAIMQSDSFHIKLRFDSHQGERIFGMGQYQQPEFDLKGCVLELAQRNSQISVPYQLSSLGYGFFWNNPGYGRVTFGKNLTEWEAASAKEIDYWITVGDTPRDLVRNFTAVTGRAPDFPDDALGLWQCKLRYRTQEEVLTVVREYHRRGIPLSRIIIDFYHWTRDGEWQFDPDFWPDPKAMVDELHEMGIKCLVSVWPTVERGSQYYKEIEARGFLVRTDRGQAQCMNEYYYVDATNEKAMDFVFERCKEHYLDYGIDGFWLDEAEPEYHSGDFDLYRYHAGPAAEVMSEYPLGYIRSFYENMKKLGCTEIANLARSTWAGGQKYGAVVWSGDINSNFETLRVQLCAGLNIGMAGIPWWNTDVGGFLDGDVTDPAFHELLIRWFQFATYGPVLRLHGDRRPHDIPKLSDKGGGKAHTGRANELWSYGEEVYAILRKYVDVREKLRPYVAELMREASADGSPLLRAMFYEFPDDERCWALDDQYMFGSRYLVAPVMALGQREREVYLPAGNWKCAGTGRVFEGGRTLTVPAPLDVIPVFERI